MFSLFLSDYWTYSLKYRCKAIINQSIIKARINYCLTYLLLQKSVKHGNKRKQNYPIQYNASACKISADPPFKDSQDIRCTLDLNHGRLRRVGRLIERFNIDAYFLLFMSWKLRSKVWTCSYSIYIYLLGDARCWWLVQYFW